MRILTQGFLPFRMQSDQNDDEKPISCGFYRLEKGTPLVYEYTYHEMKIILEGEFEISDETGQKVKAGPGDVFYFPKGSKITFTTDSYGLAFYVGCSCWLYLISSTLPSQQLIIQFNCRLVSVKKVRHKGISGPRHNSSLFLQLHFQPRWPNVSWRTSLITILW